MKTEKNMPKHLNQILGAAYGNGSAICEGTLRELGAELACSCIQGKTGFSREKGQSLEKKNGRFLAYCIHSKNGNGFPNHLKRKHHFTSGIDRSCK
jgi:hypothetical protein